MKKYLLLFLCLCRLGTMLVSCSKSKLEEAEDIVNNKKPSNGRDEVTINFYMMSESDVDPAALSAMQAQFNEIMKKYQTRVVFTIVSKDNYDATLQAAFNAGKQVDIFLNTSYENLKANIQSGRLADLTDLLSTKWLSFSNANETAEKEILDDKGNLICKYNPTISEAIMNSSYFCTEVYADDTSSTAEKSELFYGIPCSDRIGTYKYLVVHKGYADRYFLADNFAADVSSPEAKQKALDAKKKLEAELAKLGLQGNYIRQEEGTYEARENLKMIDGEEYYVCVLEKPTISYKDICSAMFCISRNSVSVGRSFEVLYELNTNPKLHTILQYGAEGLNYVVNSNKTITKIEGAPTYEMNRHYTGNYFCIYPLESEGGYETLQNAVLQNNDASCLGVIVHKSYLSRENLGKYIFNKVKAVLATDAGVLNETLKYNDQTYSVAYKGVMTNAQTVALTMEITDGDVKTAVTITAKADASTGYGFKLSYTTKGVEVTSVADFYALPRSEYQFTYSYNGAKETYKGTMVVTPADYNSGVKLSVDNKTIDIDQQKSDTMEQIQEINMALNGVLDDFLVMLDMFMAGSDTKLTVSAFGFELPSES